MVLLVCNKRPFSAGGNQIILRKCEGVCMVIVLMKLVIQLWLCVSPFLLLRCFLPACGLID